METKSIMLVGVGGQGTLLASRILGNVLLSQGYDVKVSEVHGMSQRGGSVVTYIKFGEKVYGQALAEVKNCLTQFFDDMSEEDKRDFIFSFFPFMFGIYPYTVVTDKQREAMELAGVDYTYKSIYDLTFTQAKKLLGI